jgi:hypothetical protein
MKKQWIIGWICGAVLCCGFVSGQGGLQYVKLKSENLRDAPGGNRIGELVAGSPVEIIERQPNWIKVRITGWIWEPSITSDPTQVEGFTLTASHILLRTESEAQDVLKQLKSGASFTELARQYSADKSSAAQGGSLGAFGLGDLLPEFEKAALKLKTSEISGIVKTSLGYHIIRRDN